MSTESGEGPARLGISELERRLGLNRVTIASWYRADRFPRPHYIGGHRRWWLHEVEEWEAANTSHETPLKPPRRKTA